MLRSGAPEYRAAQNRCRAGIDLVIEPDRLAGGIKARYDLAVVVEHSRAGVDLQPAEGEAVGRDDRVGAKRRPLDRAAPMRLRRLELAQAAMIELEGPAFPRVGGAGAVERLYRLQRRRRQPELLDQTFQSRGLERRNLGADRRFPARNVFDLG